MSDITSYFIVVTR